MWLCRCTLSYLIGLSLCAIFHELLNILNCHLRAAVCDGSQSRRRTGNTPSARAARRSRDMSQQAGQYLLLEILDGLAAGLEGLKQPVLLLCDLDVRQLQRRDTGSRETCLISLDGTIV